VTTPTALAFDPASLPPIESITAETDIRAFLAPGVPSELTRAALRRTWTSDPAIKNFVGLADYDWDFNAADAMAGFGPLPAIDDIGKIAARIVGYDRADAHACGASDSAPTTPTLGPERITDGAASSVETDHGAKLNREDPMKNAGKANSDDIPQDVASKQAENAKPAKLNSVKRRHGGALPK